MGEKMIAVMPYLIGVAIGISIIVVAIVINMKGNKNEEER